MFRVRAMAAVLVGGSAMAAIIIPGDARRGEQFFRTNFPLDVQRHAFPSASDRGRARIRLVFQAACPAPPIPRLFVT